MFPLLLKPIYSHQFWQQFPGSKYVPVRCREELHGALRTVNAVNVKTFLVEMIPGGDDQQGSYYTYLDEQGRNLFDFTKRVFRRFPVNMGLGSYHITDHVPEVQALALRFLRQVELRGIAHVEFKLDARDGQYKLIECNGRFTRVDCLLASSGIDLPLFVYSRVIGQPQTPPTGYRLGLRLWDPVRDFLAYRQMKRMGLLTFRDWVRSLWHPQTFPVFRWYDPLPAFFEGRRLFGLWRNHFPATPMPPDQPPNPVESEPSEERRLKELPKAYGQGS